MGDGRGLREANINSRDAGHFHVDRLDLSSTGRGCGVIKRGGATC